MFNYKLVTKPSQQSYNYLSTLNFHLYFIVLKQSPILIVLFFIFLNYSLLFQHSNGRSFALRCHFHRAILHPDSNLAKPVLLFVWFSILSIYNSSHLLLTNFNRHGLLPAVWRGEKILFNQSTMVHC